MPDDLKHGKPVPLDSTTQESEAASAYGIVLEPKFFLDLRRYGGPIVQIEPTPRMKDRFLRAVMAGNATAIRPPRDPQPNALPRVIGPAGDGSDRK